jgi:hypothetical protein
MASCRRAFEKVPEEDCALGDDWDAGERMVDASLACWEEPID